MSYTTTINTIKAVFDSLGYIQCPEQKEIEGQPLSYNHKSYILGLIEFPTNYRSNNCLEIIQKQTIQVYYENNQLEEIPNNIEDFKILLQDIGITENIIIEDITFNPNFQEYQSLAEFKINIY